MASARRVRILVRGLDHKVLDYACERISKVLRDAAASSMGPVPLPVRSSQEGRIHLRRIDLLEPERALLSQLQRLNLPAGIGIEMADL